MNKKLNLLAITAIFGYLEAATEYCSGIEADRKRNDTIRVGSAGGFDGFRVPSGKVDSLYINIVGSGTAAQANITPTFASYNGTGSSVPHLPETLKHVYIQGDASNFSALVAGTSHGAYPPFYASSAYGLPTPAAGTTVHFLLSNAPSTEPALWFQAPLPAGCRVVVEPDSQDPFINTVLPVNGGHLFIGAPVAPVAGFSAELATISAPFTIQRHPSIPATDAATKASLTIAEDTTFTCALHGVSLAGPFRPTFTKNSSLVDPSADTAAAGYNIGSNVVVEVANSQPTMTLPAFSNLNLAAGLVSDLKKCPKPATLPAICPPLFNNH